MVFVDDLAYALFALSFAGFMLLYAISSIYGSYKRGRKNFREHLEGLSVPLGILGAYMLIMGLWGQFNWPLPGSYNILYYDPFLSFGLVILAFAIAVKYRTKLGYVGFLGLLFGVMAVIYGAEGYGIGLSTEPLALLGLFFLYGAIGILSFPMALMIDRMPGSEKRHWRGWYVLLLAFLVLLLLASLLSGFIGSSAISAHLLNAP